MKVQVPVLVPVPVPVPVPVWVPVGAPHLFLAALHAVAWKRGSLTRVFLKWQALCAREIALRGPQTCHQGCCF